MNSMDGEIITRRTGFHALPQLLKPSEVCAWSGLARSTLYEDLKKGRLKGVRIGKRWLVSRESLAKFLEIETVRPDDRTTPAA